MSRAYLSLKTDLSPELLAAADRLASLALAVHDEDVERTRRDEYRQFVLSAVVMSVASLEAALDNVLIDARDRANDFKSRLELAKAIWPSAGTDGVLKVPIRKKLDELVARAGGSPFEKGVRPYQDLDALLRLRNAIVHYTPEWDTREGSEHKSLEEALKGRFELSPYEAKGSAFFPKRGISYGCAMWSVETVRTMIGELMIRLGLSGVSAPD